MAASPIRRIARFCIASRIEREEDEAFPKTCEQYSREVGTLCYGTMKAIPRITARPEQDFRVSIGERCLSQAFSL